MTDPNPKEQPVSDQQDTAKPTATHKCGSCGDGIYASTEDHGVWLHKDGFKECFMGCHSPSAYPAPAPPSSTQGAREPDDVLNRLIENQRLEFIRLRKIFDEIAIVVGPEVLESHPPNCEPEHVLEGVRKSFAVASSRNAELERAVRYECDQKIAGIDECVSLQEKLELAESRVAALTEELAELRKFKMAVELAPESAILTDLERAQLTGEAIGFNRAHEPAKCGHPRACYQDPDFGTDKYGGNESCLMCALGAIKNNER